MTGKHDGSFGEFSGTVTRPGDRIEQGSVTLELDVASMTTDTEKLTGHFKSPDFFDVGRFPKVSFPSTAVRAGQVPPRMSTTWTSGVAWASGPVWMSSPWTFRGP